MTPIEQAFWYFACLLSAIVAFMLGWTTGRQAEQYDARQRNLDRQIKDL